MHTGYVIRKFWPGYFFGKVLNQLKIENVMQLTLPEGMGQTSSRRNEPFLRVTQNYGLKNGSLQISSMVFRLTLFCEWALFWMMFFRMNPFCEWTQFLSRRNEPFLRLREPKFWHNVFPEFFIFLPSITCRNGFSKLPIYADIFGKNKKNDRILLKQQHVFAVFFRLDTTSLWLNDPNCFFGYLFGV